MPQLTPGQVILYIYILDTFIVYGQGREDPEMEWSLRHVNLIVD